MEHFKLQLMYSEDIGHRQPYIGVASADMWVRPLESRDWPRKLPDAVAIFMRR